VKPRVDTRWKKDELEKLATSATSSSLLAAQTPTARPVRHQDLKSDTKKKTPFVKSVVTSTSLSIPKKASKTPAILSPANIVDKCRQSPKNGLRFLQNKFQGQPEQVSILVW
jgi:hypothetical protein